MTYPTIRVSRRILPRNLRFAAEYIFERILTVSRCIPDVFCVHSIVLCYGLCRVLGIHAHSCISMYPACVQMYPACMLMYPEHDQDTCGIHLKYMWNTSGIHQKTIVYKVQECATGTPYPSGHRRHGCARGSTNVGTESFFSIANVPSQPKATVH